MSYANWPPPENPERLPLSRLHGVLSEVRDYLGVDNPAYRKLRRAGIVGLTKRIPTDLGRITVSAELPPHIFDDFGSASLDIFDDVRDSSLHRFNGKIEVLGFGRPHLANDSNEERLHAIADIFEASMRQVWIFDDDVPLELEAFNRNPIQIIWGPGKRGEVEVLDGNIFGTR